MKSLLADHLKIAASAIASLKQGVLPMRRPSWNQPDFWAQTITETKVQTVAGGMVEFENFLVFDTSDRYASRFTHFVMDTYDDIASTNVQFRLIRDGINVIENLDQVEMHKIASDTWPLIPREFYFTASTVEQVAIQVFNPDVGEQLIFAALYGWEYFNKPKYRGDTKEGIYDVRTVR